MKVPTGPCSRLLKCRGISVVSEFCNCNQILLIYMHGLHQITFNSLIWPTMISSALRCLIWLIDWLIECWNEYFVPLPEQSMSTVKAHNASASPCGVFHDSSLARALIVNEISWIIIYLVKLDSVCRLYCVSCWRHSSVCKTCSDYTLLSMIKFLSVTYW